MRRVPNSREVTKKLQESIKATKAALKALNQVAGQLMAKGNYSMAESMAAKGREIQVFHTELEALKKRWSQIQGSGRMKASTTPLWAYYQPILQGLRDLGGEGSRDDLEPRVEKLMKANFEPGDTVQLARGQQRWQVMIRRARKPLVAEGWLEPDSGKIWRITSAGRKAASATQTKQRPPSKTTR